MLLVSGGGGGEPRPWRVPHIRRTHIFEVKTEVEVKLKAICASVPLYIFGGELGDRWSNDSVEGSMARRTNHKAPSAKKIEPLPGDPESLEKFQVLFSS